MRDGRLFLCAVPARGGGSALLQHDLDDLLVGLPHPFAAQLADVADGVLDALGDDAVPGAELLAVQVHVVAHDAGLHAGGDLGGAAGLGPVADDARDDGQRVDQGVGDGLVVRPLQVGDAAAGGAPGADRAAVGGQPADAALFVDGDEVGHRQGPVQPVLGDGQGLGVLDHRHRHRDALVAAARVDDHRQLAAAHPGVGAGGRLGDGPVADVVAVELEHGGADVGPVVPQQALLRDEGVVLDLGVQHRADVLEVAAAGKVQNIRDGQKVPAGQAVPGGGAALVAAGGPGLLHRHIQQDLAVLFDVDDVGVVLGDADGGGLLPGGQPDGDVEDLAVVHRFHLDGRHGQEAAHLRFLLFGHFGDHLQGAACLAAHDAGGRRGLDPLHPAGVGHDDALDILDDVVADSQPDLAGQSAQHLPGLGRRVGDGDGLGAAHGGDQLFV